MGVAYRVGGPPGPGPRPAMIDPVLEQLDAVQLRAEAHPPRCREDGLACVNRLLTAIVQEVRDRLGLVFDDPEFGATLVVQLTWRYLQAVGDLRTDTAVPRSWRVLLDRRDAADITAEQFTLAAVSTLIHHDLGPALVSTATVLGRSLGPVEKADCDALVAVVAERARMLETETAQDAGFAAALSRNGAWRVAEHLWTLRGRPVEAEAERAALDWRVSMIGQALLRPVSA